MGPARRIVRSCSGPRPSSGLLTFDKDFGDLAYSAQLPASCGVILVRIQALRGEQAISRLTDVLASRTDWAGHFSVIEPDRIRMRALPGRKD